MTPADILSQVRYITKTSSTENAGDTTALLRMLNDYYLRLSMVFIDTNDDLFGRKADTNLNVSSNQEAYLLPTDMVKLKRVEITYDGTNWYKVTLEDDNEFRDIAMSSTNINNNFTQTQPYANVFGNVLYLRPIPTTAVSGGLRAYYIGRPTLITNISLDAFGIPTDYQGYLVYGIAGEVATRQGDSALSAAMFQKWEDGQNKVRMMFAPRKLDYEAGFRDLSGSIFT